MVRGCGCVFWGGRVAIFLPVFGAWPHEVGCLSALPVEIERTVIRSSSEAEQAVAFFQLCNVLSVAG